MGRTFVTRAETNLMVNAKIDFCSLIWHDGETLRWPPLREATRDYKAIAQLKAGSLATIQMESSRSSDIAAD
jgi:hypothetical protein